MKFAIVIADGCADEPQESLGGKTPLEAADTPAMDELARMGVVGRANHTPPCYVAGSDVANLSLLGCDPHQYYSGRAPIEAVAAGIDLSPHDWAIRCNLVTVENQVMRDFTADHISSEEARRLLATAQNALRSLPGPVAGRSEFKPGVSYRNLLIYRGQAGEPAPLSRETRATPPHDLTDQAINDDFPRGPGSHELAEIMRHSLTWFADHEVNRIRISRGQLPATNVWLWGQGQTPRLPSFHERFGWSGAMITAVDLLRGLAKLIGWECLEVAGATGYLDTDYAAKGAAAVAALDRFDLVAVHIEAPDEASHRGNIAEKIAAMESIDRLIVAPLLAELRTKPAWRMLVTPDHPTPVRTKTHSHGDVPFVMAGSGIAANASQEYGEKAAAASELAFPNGWELMSLFAART